MRTRQSVATYYQGSLRFPQKTQVIMHNDFIKILIF